MDRENQPQTNGYSKNNKEETTGQPPIDLVVPTSRPSCLLPRGKSKFSPSPAFGDPETRYLGAFMQSSRARTK